MRTIQTANAVAELLNLPIKLETGLSEWLNPARIEQPERLSTPALAKLFPRIDSSYTSRIAAKYPETHKKVRERSSGKLPDVQLLISSQRISC